MSHHLSRFSRRQFLATTAAGAALAWRRSCWAGSSLVDPQRFVLLSDTHVWEDRQHLKSGVKPADHFILARDEILALQPRPAGLVINGDCACLEGHAADYAVLRELLEPVRRAGIPLHFVLGNHDHRQTFCTSFKELLPAASPVADKLVSLVETPAANWVLLDSLDHTSVTPGLLGRAQLDWLAATLDAHAGRPAIIMAHHDLAATPAASPSPPAAPAKPVKPGEPSQPKAPAKNTGLLDTAELLKVLLPRKQVKLYFYGHTHRWGHSQRGGLPLFNLPTLVWVFDAQQPRGWVDAHLRADGISCELHALDKTHPAHGQCWNIAWRT